MTQSPADSMNKFFGLFCQCGFTLNRLLILNAYVQAQGKILNMENWMLSFAPHNLENIILHGHLREDVYTVPSRIIEDPR